MGAPSVEVLRRRGADGSPAAPSRDSAERAHEGDGGGGARVVCATCGHTVTTAAARTEVDGEHRHVCVNPSGIPFDIACYATAPGCVGHGPSESHWTWFEGYRWRIALCGGCSRHLGWSFERPNSSFFGLIAARIRESVD